uniref:hypothetical protein n=1 Tax=Spiroplasma melliferum TaxID=2134 RepID=UPI0015E12D02
TDSKVIKRKIQELDKWFIFPFVITNGIIPLTTSGYKPINSVPQDYSDFTLAITGNATIIAQWKNAFKLEQVNKGTKDNNFKDADNFYTKIINPMKYDTDRGDMFEAYLQNSTSGAYFSNQGTPDPVFQGISTQRQYTLLSTEKQFGQNDELSLYIVLNNNNENIGGETINTYEYNQSIQWLYISNITDYYDPFDNKKFLFQEITFSSVNDQLSKSGMAIWQKIQHGAIGEGYFFPRIINGVVDYDPELAKDMGVKWIDLKVLGLTAFTSLTMIGRPVKAGQINTRVYQPRDLLFSDELSGMPDTLLTNSNPANVLYNLQSLVPMNETTYGEWTNIFNAMADPLAKKNAEGVIGTNLTDTQATNPNKIPFWDQSLQFKPKGIYNTKQIRKFIYQDPEYKKAPFGLVEFDYSKMKWSTFHDILNANRYTHSSISLLPYKVNEYTKFSINNLPVVGKFLSFFDLGLPVKLMSQKDTSLIPKIAQLNAFMDQQTYDIIQASLWNENSRGKGLLPLDLFRNETEDQVGALLGSNSLTFGCMLELTDKIKTHYYSSTGDDLGTKIYSTIDLGQNRIDINGGNDEIVILSQDYEIQKKDTPLTNLDTKLEFNPTEDGTLESYVIDLFSLQTIGKTNFKITTYSENPFVLNDNITAFQNFQGEWQTMAKFIKPNGNMQSWNSVIKTSSLDYDLNEETTFFYPKAVLPPDPFKYKPVVIPYLDANQSVRVKGNGVISPPKCITGPDSMRNIWNKDNNPYVVDNDYIITYDLSTIDPTITTINQFKRAYTQINITGANNLWFWLESNKDNFNDTFNLNWEVTGGNGNCNNNLGSIIDWQSGPVGKAQNTKTNFQPSFFIDTSSLSNIPQKFAINDVNILENGTYGISINGDNLHKRCFFINSISSVSTESNIWKYESRKNSIKIWISDDFKLHIGVSKVSYPFIGIFDNDSDNYNYSGNTNEIQYIADTIHMVNQGGKIDITLIPSN